MVKYGEQKNKNTSETVLPETGRIIQADRQDQAVAVSQGGAARHPHHRKNGRTGQGHDTLQPYICDQQFQKQPRRKMAQKQMVQKVMRRLSRAGLETGKVFCHHVSPAPWIHACRPKGLTCQKDCPE